MKILNFTLLMSLSASVSVSCSTITVSKCQIALKTLRAFPFFSPECLCNSMQAEPECNQFRDLVFRHPCEKVIDSKGKEIISLMGPFRNQFLNGSFFYFQSNKLKKLADLEEKTFER